MRFERLTDSELSRTPEGWHGNPEAVRSGFCAKHKTDIELPPGANDLQDDRGVGFTVCYAIFIVLRQLVRERTHLTIIAVLQYIESRPTHDNW